MSDLDAHLPAIAAGDPDAFARWVAGAEPVIRMSLGTYAARVDTEALVQETLLRVWQVAPRVVPDGKGSSLLRLGVRIARNLAVSELRRARTGPADIEALERWLHEADAVREHEGGDPLLRELIARCREKLPRRPAQALAARLDSAGAVPDETLAARLSMKLNTFLQNFGRARRLLAECLERGGVDLEAELP